jgi:hypothetical protein
MEKFQRAYQRPQIKLAFPTRQQYKAHLLRRAYKPQFLFARWFTRFHHPLLGRFLLLQLTFFFQA